MNLFDSNWWYIFFGEIYVFKSTSINKLCFVCLLKAFQLTFEDWPFYVEISFNTVSFS